MNTPAHLLMGAAAFSRHNDNAVTRAALFGALMPDLSLYLLGGVSLFILRIPGEVVFNELYFSNLWQTIFAIDNSVILWGLLLGAAIWRKSAALVAFAGAALLHIAFDFPLHHDDGRAHFWPLSDWVFESPVSYWDSAHHAGWVVPVSALLAVGLTVILWRRHLSWPLRAFFLALLGLEIWAARQWLMFF